MIGAIGVALALAASASPRLPGAPAATAADVPELAQLLERTGWTPTPELSGVFQVGHVFSISDDRHSVMVRACFDAPVARDAYPSIDLNSQLQAGVRVGWGAGRARVSGDVVRQLTFDAPEHHTVARLAMQPTPACAEMLSRVEPAARRDLIAVQEVLTARITTQTCGRIDAEGRMVGLGSADMALARACAQTSLEPVAVAWRTVPLDEVWQPPHDPTAATDPTACPWGPIRAVSSTMTSLTVNGQTMDVRGLEARTAIAQTMQRCGRPEAARAFEEWRLRRRVVNVSGATLVGMWPFGVGLLAARQAEDWRLRTEALLLDPALADEREGGWRKKVRQPR